MKANKMIIAFVLAVFLSSCSAAKFPSSWKPCKLNDPNHNECMKKSIQGTLPDFLKGMPQFGIASIDPLHFDYIGIKQGNGPVSINLAFKNLDILNIKNGRVDKVKNDWKTLIIEVTVPVLELKGDYNISGKVLVLPISGNGKCHLKLEKFYGKMVAKIVERTVKGKTYYLIDSMKCDLDANPLRLKFDNMFNGNKQLSDQMNIFLNENWKEIFKEVKPAVSDALSQAFTGIANQVFSRIPKNEITPP